MIDQRYEIKNQIDEGTNAKVYLAQDWHQNGKFVVLKIIRPQSYEKPQDKKQVKLEIENHSIMKHKNVLSMLGHSYNGVMHVKGEADCKSTYIYLVTEYLGQNYVNFFDLIEVSRGAGFGEDTGRLFLNQMLDALDYMHEQASVCHRDLKLENILIDGQLTFKLIDMGVSASGDLDRVSGAVGSCRYVAPEVLTDHTYDGRKVDLFSIGVLLFVMVHGRFPHGTKILQCKYYGMIKDKRYDEYFQAVKGTNLSSCFKELIVSLLAYNPAERPTIAQIRKCTFLCCKNYNEEQTRE